MGNPPSFGKLSETVHEPEGLWFPSPAGAMERAPQELSPPELVGTMATASTQETGLFVPRRYYGSCANSKHVPPISDCGYILILICQQALLQKLLCSDPFSDAPCLIPLHTEGQISALLSPWAGLLLCRGSRCFFKISAFDGSQALESRVGLLPASDKGWLHGHVPSVCCSPPGCSSAP